MSHTRQEKRLVWLFCMSILNVKDAVMRMVFNFAATNLHFSAAR